MITNWISSRTKQRHKDKLCQSKKRQDKQNSKSGLCCNRDKTNNHITRERSKLLNKLYLTRLNCVEKVIHWELFKKFKFDHTNKWYMYNLESILANETHKLLYDFEIQTDNLISTSRTYLRIGKKNRTREPAELWTLPHGRPQSKIERKRKER